MGLSNPADHLVSGFHFRGVLPHLKREGRSYFVTFRLAGTLPREVLIRFKQEREAILQHALAARCPLTWHEQVELVHWYSNRVDKYLDAGNGKCYLRRRGCANIVADSLRFFDGQRYHLHAWVVMPNHVHLVVRPEPPYSLSDNLQGWKSFTAHRINALLPQKVVPFWQDESYDHLVRDDEDMHRMCRYTIANPAAVGDLDRWAGARALPILKLNFLGTFRVDLLALLN